MKRSIILLTIGFVASINAYGYRLNTVAEAGARWAELPISMRLNPANAGLPSDEVQRVISQTMGKWGTGIGSEVLTISSVDGSITAAHAMDQDGINAIAFSDNFRNDSNGFDPDVTVAIGGQYGNGDTMSDAFVIFNAEQVAWTTDQINNPPRGMYSDDLETIALHELGHVLGLGHSEDTSAVMTGQRQTKILRELTADDIAGGRFVTQAGAAGSGASSDKSGAGNSGGCGYIADNDSNNNNIAGMTALMLLPLTALIFARRRVMVLSR